MKKIILTAFILFILSAFFGIGMGIAEIVLRFDSEKKEASYIFPLIDKQEQKEIEKRIDKNPQETEQLEEKDQENTEQNIPPQQTVVPAPETFSFAIVGDTQSYKPGVSGGFSKAVKQISSLKPDLIFAVGDLVSSCKDDCEEKLSNWRSIWGTLTSKVYSVQGNHDRTGKEKSDSAWQEVFNLPTNGPAGYSELTYSFDFKNSHFVFLDSEKPEEHLINGTQRAWLEKDLARNKKPNIFVFFHEPAYPVSSKIGESLDVKPNDRDALWNILARYKVSAVFVGHEHIHSRRKINSIYQFGFGNTESFNHDMPKTGVAEYAYQGEHFGIVEIKDEEITVKVYTVNGKILDTKSLTK